MTDIDKKIAELKELMEKATPGLLKIDEPDEEGDVFIRDANGQMVSIAPVSISTLIVAMHNALPEILEEIKALTEARNDLANGYETVTKERNVANARAEKAEEQTLEASNKLERWRERVDKAENEVRRLQTTPAEKREDLYCVISDLSRQTKEAEKHAEQMQAEREILLTEISKLECPYNPAKQRPCVNPERGKADDCCYQKPQPCWEIYIAQKAAKAGEEV